MPFHHSPSAAPRAGIDPIASATDALALFHLVASRPLAHETLGVLLDAEGRGDTVTVVSDTQRPDAVLDVAQCLGIVAERMPKLTSLVLATIRPRSGMLPGDIDRWLEATSIAEEHDLQLLEWFVIGPAGPECPRDLLGEPERW